MPEAWAGPAGCVALVAKAVQALLVDKTSHHPRALKVSAETHRRVWAKCRGLQGRLEQLQGASPRVAPVDLVAVALAGSSTAPLQAQH